MVFALSAKIIEGYFTVTVEHGEKNYSFEPDYGNKQCITQWVQGLIDLKKGRTNSICIEFDLESKGYMYMVVTRYPFPLFHLVFYESICWDEYDDYHHDLPLPVPAFETLLPSLTYFSRYLAEDLAKIDREDLERFDTSFFYMLEDLKKAEL